MHIRQLYTNCLAEAAYYIESNGEAAIIDPLRETQPYLDLATKRNAKIKYVFETHFHADFVSGHVDLAKATGAQIIYGPTAQADYDITVAEDEQEFPLGKINLKILHTPGHTMESSCIVAIDEHGKEYAVFTGDTLFIGDVGRPDLAVSASISRDDLAAKLFHSLHNKVLTLPDEVKVFPGHGAGSQCGKNLSSETVSTIGEQKKFNYALQENTEEGFVKVVTAGLQAPPQYFPKNAQINKRGYGNINELLKKANQPLDVNEFRRKIAKDTLIIDTRSSPLFCQSHIPQSINISLEGFFAVWVGTLIENMRTPILLVTSRNQEEETILRLARVGYENVIGYLKGGFESWEEAKLPLETIPTIPAAEFRNLPPSSAAIIDVRRSDEFEEGHWDGAINIPLAELPELKIILNADKHHYLYCKSGYRSGIAASLLQKSGFKMVENVEGGFDAINDFAGSSCCILPQ